MKKQIQTIPDLFIHGVERFPDNPLVYEKVEGKYQAITYKELQKDVIAFASGLLSLGIRKGDRIALLAEGRSEWLISELAMLFLGIIDVPLSIKLNEPSELKFRLQHSGCTYIIVSERQLDKVTAIRNELSDLKNLIIISDTDDIKTEALIYKDLLNYSDELNNKVLKIAKTLNGDDIANISYTSGTTADPKGIMLSHRNYTSNVEQAASLLEIHSYFTSLLILPWDHSFAHTVGLYTLINNGASLSVVEMGKTAMETLKNIPKNIKETKPTFLLSVPALAKNFKKNIEKGVAAKGTFTKKLFEHALAVSYRYNGLGWDKGKGSKAFLKPLVFLYDKILFSKIRDNFGGRLEFFIGGGALLDIELQKFFYAIGIPMYQGYGLSEASPIISSNAPQRHKLGSSGFLVKPLDLKILDDNGIELPVGEKGEIVVRGENVMKGYWKNEEATKDTLRDGWLHTGDMGFMDKDGFLYVLGRFKSLLIGNDGEKYSPEGIEEALIEQSMFFDQIMLYNNQNSYTIALLHPNYALIKKAIEEKGLSLNSDDAVKEALQIIKNEIDKYLSGGPYSNMFPHRWIPAAIGLISEAFTEENKMINSTMKMVRGKVVETYQPLIDYLYTAEGKSLENNKNIEVLKEQLQ